MVSTIDYLEKLRSIKEKVTHTEKEKRDIFFENE